MGLPEDGRTALRFAGSGHKATKMGDCHGKGRLPRLFDVHPPVLLRAPFNFLQCSRLI